MTPIVANRSANHSVYSSCVITCFFYDDFDSPTIVNWIHIISTGISSPTALITAKSSLSSTSTMAPAQAQVSRIELSDNPLLQRLHALHADEFTDLRKKASLFNKKSDQSWSIRSLALIRQYFIFIFTTWKRAVWSVMLYPTSELHVLSLLAAQS